MTQSRVHWIGRAWVNMVAGGLVPAGLLSEGDGKATPPPPPGPWPGETPRNHPDDPAHQAPTGPGA